MECGYNMDSGLKSKNEKLVYERWFNGMDICMDGH